jgi:hypothetical protein
MARLLKWATGDVLRTGNSIVTLALLLTSPLLKTYPALSVSFVRGIIELGDEHRTEILQLPVDKKPRHVIYWDLPFLLNSDRSFEHDAPWCLNILIGVCRLVYVI